MNNRRRTWITVCIITLSVLLAASIIALCVVITLKTTATDNTPDVVVTDNVISPDSSPVAAVQTNKLRANADFLPHSARSAQTTLPDVGSASQFYLNNSNPQDNTPFSVTNMFPGDSETKYYRISIAYKDTVTVHYHADIRPGYEKLSEVLMVRISLIGDGVLYEGLMRDMPESIDHVLRTSGPQTDDLYYEINAYLTTDVDNEYMREELIADFRWWVAETENLEPPPATGDSSLALYSGLIAVACAAVVTVLIVVRRRRNAHE